MKKLLKSKVKGLEESLAESFRKIENCTLDITNFRKFSNLISEEMKRLDFDKVTTDKVGNLIGVIKGHESKKHLVIISHIDIPSTDTFSSQIRKTEINVKGEIVKFKTGIISSIYGAALMKRALLPLTGDLIVCCVPRTECCDYGIKYLFEDYLKPKLKKIYGVILSEPTGFNIYLGHKGRMEYEIIVKGKLYRHFVENRGMNMLGTMFPLINELEKVSKQLPCDPNLGYSDLKIKDVRYSGYHPEKEFSEFRVVVDRVFIPEEDLNGILNKAKTIAKAIYKGKPDLTVNAVLARERVKTYSGVEIVQEKKFKPWKMESHHPFALNSLRSLTENGFKSSFGYWKKITTEGSYTYAQLHIPTIGFGAGSEDIIESGVKSLSLEKLKKAVYGLGLIIYRNIGMPTFGWSSDEI